MEEQVTNSAVVAAAVETDAGAERVFDVLVDWPRHAEWMFLTSAQALTGAGRGVGSTIEAFTGLGPVGFSDPMTITTWRPPELIVMEHTGRVVRGIGVIRVLALPGGGSRIIWAERLHLPYGRAGRAAFSLAKPVMRALAVHSLRKLARLAS
ncbi:SRPBCC family protein [Nonomuraea sp. NPDC050663]|uniref:SRPBCC family protein n=1 Tax=Nonomuraea sp. NPDC050663 TaxID=3364370 RepID=UPI00379AB814